ncbi:MULTISPECIES: methylated-DNA--[protein]-cysteine S-methyltransferase [Methylotuvimicrobium]|uniref:Methylated-DNA/protein-cysteine methyltransferase n=2 Tax=Methylotuvimicrobium TaxID=2822410 RepID=G4T229_META2|nr:MULTISPECIES: methylated-DNA--[protein]-cysteine S-methyltransferase [Methylotuvimicrobium]QCW83856.1 methylated-DNA--[protein]-cysteine S-methyltransferase [Methylotuvimicrobium buryatense]CCE22455.1 Methylated-DNA/protein-cysteine methyltransferase [Methylotuvimicrobium alcaliphilum 20Z]
MPFIVHWVSECQGAKNIRILQTPAGKLSVQRCGEVICGIDWLPGGPVMVSSLDNDDKQSFDPVENYWREPNAIVELKLLRRGSPFVQTVQDALLRIPFGTTLTYKDLAKVLDSAPRAVGGACRRNDYPLIVPCHRVVSVTGPGGYSGQTQGESMAVKLQLLAFEASFNQ